MELKINRAIKCLYIAVGVKILELAYGFYFSATVLNDPQVNAVMGFTNYSYLLPSLVFFGLFASGAYYVLAQLKIKSNIGWLGGIVLFVLSLPSFALPFSVFGLISLLDQDVRNPYLRSLDIKL